MAKMIIVPALLLFLTYLVIRKKLDLFGVVLFLVPFQLLKVDVGVTIYAYQAAILLITVKNIIVSIHRTHINLISMRNKVFVLFIAYAVFMTLLMVLLNDTYVSEGGFFRREGRFLAQIALLFLSVAIIPLAFNYVKCLDDLQRYVKVFIMGLVFLMALGWLQWLIYKYSGVDIFPLMELRERSVSGLYNLNGEMLFRMSSLGGEPKTFSVSLIFGFFIIYVFNSFELKIYALDRLLKYAFALTAFVTLSTSGIVMFAILFMVTMLLLASNGKSIKPSIKQLSLSTFIVIALASVVYVKYDLIAMLFQERVLERNLTSEDFDLVVQIFLLHNPSYLLFGTGLGNIHNFASTYIPAEFSSYMTGTTIFTAKSGYLKIVSELGLFGLSLFFLYNYVILKNVKNKLLFLTKREVQVMRAVSVVFILGIVLYLARTSAFGIYIAFFSIFNVIAYKMRRMAYEKN